MSNEDSLAQSQDDSELPSGPKYYMLKLIEYNKIAILEN